MSKNAELKCTWTNCLIWSLISLAVGVGLRMLLWYIIVFMGDSGIYFDKFCYGIVWMLLVSAIFPVLFYIPTYRGYMKRAAIHPDDLYGVAHGKYGRPWILKIILMLLVDALWLIISAIIVYMGYALDVAMEADRICFFTYLGLSGGNIVINIVLFLLGALIFQPNLVSKSK